MYAFTISLGILLFLNNKGFYLKGIYRYPTTTRFFVLQVPLSQMNGVVNQS